MQRADVLVVFGITGDLAKVMTFHSLYRLCARGLLDCPVVGVAAHDWTVQEVRDHARSCIESAMSEPVDDEVSARFAARLAGLADAQLTEHARVVGEKPFGHDVASAGGLNAEVHQYIDESQLYRIDHFLGKMGLVEIPYLRFANAALVGDSKRFTRQDSVEEDWRVMQPLLDAPPDVHAYVKGSWGPEAGDGLLTDHGAWHEPWVAA